jgi:predicted transcriptional regulator
MDKYLRTNYRNVINQPLRNILEIVADLSHNNVNNNIFDTAVAEYSDLSSTKVNCYLTQLSSLGLIKMLKRVSDAEKDKDKYFRLLNITQKGLQELSNNIPQSSFLINA